MDSLEERLHMSRQASRNMGILEGQQKNRILDQLALLMDENREFLLRENRKDQDVQRGRISDSLFQRLILTDVKLDLLIQGVRDVERLEDPVGKILSRVELDDGLILSKVTVPIGVIGIIFESRPDVVPQILSLILKSGNAVVMKGGKEAHFSNHAFFELVSQLETRAPELPQGWAHLIDDREDVWRMLQLPEALDLIIPRGSKKLVGKIMASSQIPVLGHSEGICHLYVDREAGLDQAVTLAIDSKVQYPAACNALETLLVHREIAPHFLPRFLEAARAAEVRLRGCDASREIGPEIEPATEEDWRLEYGDPTLAVRVVPDLEAAVSHINQFGSHHTDSIVSSNPDTCDRFLKEVDSACVFSNSSTRFADGFRFGFGAELGISTARTHARGPVGLEGLVIYKYLVRGQGHKVQDYVGDSARPFRHRTLDPR